MSDGQKPRLTGQGGGGAGNGPSGDLYLTVRVQPHPLLRREDLPQSVRTIVETAGVVARMQRKRTLTLSALSSKASDIIGGVLISLGPTAHPGAGPSAGSAAGAGAEGGSGTDNDDGGWGDKNTALV